MWTANNSGNSVTKISPTGATTTYTGVGSEPEGIAFDGTNMWTANYGGNSVSEISPTGTITTYPGIGSEPEGIAFDGANMWVADYGSGDVTKVYLPVSGTSSNYTINTEVAPSLAISMSDYALTTGQSAMVTFAFSSSSVPTSFNAGEITAPNGTISNLATTSNPLVYTATFTPNANVSSNSNTISVNLSLATTTYAYSSYSISGFPDAIAFDGTNMWTANPAFNSVTKISPTGGMTNYTYLDASVDPTDIAFDGTNMWITNPSFNSVSKISPAGFIIATTSGLGILPTGIAFDGTNMWTANQTGNSVTKISPTGATTTYPGVGSGPHAIAFDGTNMWTTDYGGSGSVTKISPTGATTTYAVGIYPIAIAFDGTNMWAAVGNNTVDKISSTGNVIAYPGTGGDPYGIAFDGTNMWTANYASSSVTEISPSGAMTTYGGIGSEPTAIAFDGTNMWTANAGGSVTKITPPLSAVSANYTVNTVANTANNQNTQTPTAAYASAGGGFTSSTVTAEVLSQILAPSAAATAYINSLTQTGTTGTNAVPISSVATSTVSSTAISTIPTFIFTRNLTIGSTGPDVLALQEYLNNNGYSLASTGPGSPGNETDMFGDLTKAALALFQKAHGVSPSAGYFGPITRKFLNQ
jgi:hypothetical protein